MHELIVLDRLVDEGREAASGMRGENPLMQKMDDQFRHIMDMCTAESPEELMWLGRSHVVVRCLAKYPVVDADRFGEAVVALESILNDASRMSVALRTAVWCSGESR